MLPEGNWITRAPSLRRKAALLAKVQDEGGHGLYLYAAAETLGVSREELVDQLLAGKAKYSSIFNYPTLTWADIGAIGWLVDGAAIMNQIPLCRCSYGPYARAMIRVCKEESFHQRQGYEIMLTLARGTAEQKAMAQDALNRWWWPVPDDVRSARPGEPAQRHLDALEDQALLQRRAAPEIRRCHGAAGAVSRPDAFPIPALSFDEATGHWEYGAIDWDEFKQVLAGNGPCNRDRMAARRKAHDDGAWVREAALAYAEKRSARASVAQAADESRRDHRWPRRTCRSGKSSSAAATGSRTSMSARCTPPTPRWRCRPRATSTPAAARGCRSGWCRRTRSPPPTRPTRA